MLYFRVEGRDAVGPAELEESGHVLFGLLGEPFRVEEVGPGDAPGRHAKEHFALAVDEFEDCLGGHVAETGGEFHDPGISSWTGTISLRQCVE